MNKQIRVRKDYANQAWQILSPDMRDNEKVHCMGDNGGLWFSKPFTAAGTYISVRCRADSDYRGYSGNVSIEKWKTMMLRPYSMPLTLSQEELPAWIKHKTEREKKAIKHRLPWNFRHILYEIYHVLGEEADVIISPRGILAECDAIGYIYPQELGDFKPFYLPHPCWCYLMSDRPSHDATFWQSTAGTQVFCLNASDWNIFGKLRVATSEELKRFPRESLCSQYETSVGVTFDGILFAKRKWGEFQK